MLTTLLALFLIGFTPTLDAAKVETALQELNAPAVEKRVQGLRQLATLPADKNAMEPLLAALRDPSPAVRLEAVKTWGKVGNDYDSLENRLLRQQARNMDYEDGKIYRKKQHSVWMKRLFASFKANALDPDKNLRRETLRELAIIEADGPGSISNCTEFIETLSTEANDCLYEVSENQEPLLFTLLHDNNPDVVYLAAKMHLNKTKAERLQPVFRRFLLDKRPEWRSMGITGLSWAGLTEAYFLRILPLLGDADESVRVNALFYFKFLAKDGDKDNPLNIDSEITAAYMQAEPLLRCSILQIPCQANTQLCPLALQDTDGEVRAMAIHRMDYPGSSLDTSYLVTQLQYPHPRVREEASEALWNRKDAQTLDLLLPLLNDPDAEVRGAQIANLSGESDAHITQPLLQVLRRSENKEGWLSGKVSSHLIKLGKPAIPLVRQLLHDDSPHVQLAALEAMAELIPEEASALLLDALKDKSPSVRAKAAQLFKAPADETVETALLSLLKDKKAQVRLAVIGKLGEIGGATALAQLSSLSEEEDDEADEALLQAIQRLKKPE